MSYTVKEAFITLQGEGAQAGRLAVFIRFSGCNLWSGREEDRAGADCTFCDTDFVGINDDGGRYADPGSLADRAAALWGPAAGPRYVVLTGGEPLLQVDAGLIDALHARDFEIAIESNGTIAAPPGIDWICISPKAGTEVVQRRGNELKLVYPQTGLHPDEVAGWAFDHFFLQPMDGPSLRDNQQAAMRFIYTHPRWRLSVQTHKLIGLR
jgi:7-carboxy-7-deazaguanine synthase (Cx14CxxC type)